MAREVRLSLATFARSTSFLDDRQRNTLHRDLEQQRQIAVIAPVFTWLWARHRKVFFAKP
jgi:hypothetical protein